MTGALTVSLVIVSHSRPESLARLLGSLRHQTLRSFQTIVVSNTPLPGVAAPERVWFKERNISAARNAGIARATGDAVAFCDDDAVPEPAWLERLTAPFLDARIGASGGYVRNRNGMAFQSKAVVVDMCGRDTQLDMDESETWSCPTAPEGQVFKTIGTNCAFRRTALVKAGGFDPAMRFFLEDVDLNIRLADARWLTAIVPSAEVHHGLHAGPLRTARGVPTDLLEIGASLAYFLHKHCAPDKIDQVVADFRLQRKHRLQRLRSRGLLSKSNVQKLLRSLEDGFDEGVRRSRKKSPQHFIKQDPDLRPVQQKPASERIALLARPFRRRVARYLARRLAADGCDVTLIDFRPGVRFLTVRYLSEGYWLHRGGSSGLGERSGPRLRFATVRRRCREELQRIAGQRSFDMVHEVSAWTARKELKSVGLGAGSDVAPPFAGNRAGGSGKLNPTLR